MADSHCQLVNCSVGTMAIATTGTARATLIHSRVRSRRTLASSAPSTRRPGR